ncbi:MAG: DUF4395 domain-containing protein [Actinobacteria bacterium]|nr:DUF4395 domain-containing protein [Actinomycetota bacterium]
MSASETATRRPQGIDPRGPRFAATITATLLLIGTYLAAIGTATAHNGDGWAVTDASFATRIADPGFVVLFAIAALFLWAVLSPRTQPYGAIFRTVIRPRLKPPTELEDPRPPRFAQGVGLFVVTLGLLLHVGGVPLALPIAGAAAFVAAFLNAAIGLCLGCQLYLLLARTGLIGRCSSVA